MIAGSDVLVRELLARVDDVALDRADLARLALDHVVVLARLAEVDGQRDDLGVVALLDPLQHHARVEAAGVEQQHAVDVGRDRPRSSRCAARVRVALSSGPKAIPAPRRSRARQSSISASPITSGGRKRTVVGPGRVDDEALLEQRAAHDLRARRRRARRRASGRGRGPGVTCGSVARRSRRRSPSSRTRASSASSSSTSSAAWAAAQTTGPPAKVEPWSPGAKVSAWRGPVIMRADRQAAAERLGGRHQVGDDARVLVGPGGAGAPEAGLDLVEDQRRAGRVAALARGAQQLVGQHVHAALALDRLEDHRGGVLVDDRAQRVDRRRRR